MRMNRSFGWRRHRVGWRCWVGWLMWAWALACAAQAVPAQSRQRVALLVGNSQYQHESSLANPVRDVRLLAQSLRGLGFKAEVLENLPKREMELAIKRFVRDSAGADTALLYYAGHGQQPSRGGRSYLLPVNANAVDDDQLEADGILAEDIATQLERLPNPARLRLVVLDACRNTRAVSRSTVRGLAPPARTDSFTLIAYSTDANAVAQDGAGQHSPYAQALAKHLPSLASRPVRQVFEDTAREVRQATRQQQSPRTYGDLESRIGLDGKEMLPPADTEHTRWAAASRDNTEAAYAAYLQAYPQGLYAAAARNALAALRVVPGLAQTGRTQTAQKLPHGAEVPANALPLDPLLHGRYQVLGDGSEVKDMQTGLVWARCSVGQRWSGGICAGEAKTLTLDKAQKLATGSWRVPTVRELASLIYCSTGKTKDGDDPKDGGGPIANICVDDDTRPTIRSDAFPNTPSLRFWTSSPYAGGSYFAWLVNFYGGYVYSYGNRDDYNAARLVRAPE